MMYFSALTLEFGGFFLGLMDYFFILGLYGRYLQHWRWSWKWEWNNYKKAWHVVDFEAHCPECNTPMIEQSHMFEGF